MEGGKQAAAGDQAGEAAEGEEVKEEDPDADLPADGLNLLHFLEQEDLSDCTVKLPPAKVPAAAGQDAEAEKAKDTVHCHRVVLCASSGYFYRKFHPAPAADGSKAKDAVPSEVELPTLPEDAELRRQVDVRAIFPTVLRYIYSPQVWDAIKEQVTPENAIGIFAVACLLDVKPLMQKAFAYLNSSVLTPATSARLLYVAVKLRDEAKNKKVFQESIDRCAEVMRGGFSETCKDPEAVGLLCRLPYEVLVSLLQADDLEVGSEAEVLRVVRRLLQGRMRRKEVMLTISDAKLTQAPDLMQQLKKANGVVWEFLVVEEAPPPLGPAPPTADAQASSLPASWLAKPEVAKYATATAAVTLEASAASECEIGKEFALRVPESALRRGCVLVRACAAADGGRAGEVLLAGALPKEGVPASGAEAAEGQASVSSTDGKLSGTVQFRWKVGEAPPYPEEKTEEEKEKEKKDAKPEEKAAPVEGGPRLTEQEATACLETVRFPHLEHKELLAAHQDPVLLEAGAQPVVLEALSSRLEAYEQIAASGRVKKAPRPSTVRKASGLGAGRRPPSVSRTQRPRDPAASAPPAPDADATAAAMAQPPVDFRAGSAGLGGPRSGLGGVAGHPLFPCGNCGGQGQLLLRQRDLQWVAQCNRTACQNTIALPRCVMAAAIDGHCATCTVKHSCDVRTLTVRVGREHAAALQRLPGGVDTLRGVCIAGCNNTLGMLEVA